MPRLTLQLSGTFSAAIDDTPITKFRSDKARALLAYLAVEADVDHRRETVGLMFWATSPAERARANIRNTLSNLKQLLADVPDALTITRQTVRLNSAEINLDVTQFSENPQRNIDQYRGNFLGGLSLTDAQDFDEWRLMQQERLHLLAMSTLDDLQAGALAQADYGALADFARQQIFIEPWHESAYRSLLIGLVGQGQQQAASEQYARCRAVMQNELGVELSPETEALWQRLQDEGVKQPEIPVKAARHNLPSALPPFFGRTRELTAITNALANRRYRLLTLTGLGGSGKTRLALAAAQSQLDQFADGVWFVPLAAANTVAQIVPTIADAMSIELAGDGPVAEQLQRRLKTQETLLVLDNLEQLPDDAADVINDLLQATEQLVIVATSRRRLQLRIEKLFPIEGLPVPPEDTEAEIDAFASLSLFAEQMVRLNPFAAAQDDVASMGEVCRLVDGLPLGIELAAAQLEQRSLREIVSVLRGTLRDLQTSMRDVPARQRSLRAVFESSWVLLTEPQQAVLAQLSIFRGGFAFDALRTVVPQATESILARLVAQSLVRELGDGRYGLHPLVREFSAEKSPTPAVAHRHSHHYLTTAQSLEERWYGLQFAAAQQEARRDWGNMDAAWQHAIATPDWPLLEDSVQGVRSLYRFAVRYREGATLFADAFAQLEPLASQPDHQRVLGQIQAALVWFLVQLHDHDSAELAVTRTLAYADAIDSPDLALDVQLSQQILLTQQDKLDLSLSLSESVIALAQEHDAPLLVARAQLDAGFVHMLKGQFAQGRKLLQQAEATFREVGNVLDALTALRNVGIANMMLRELESAEKQMLAALDMARQRQDREREIFVIDTLGSVYYQSGDYGRAIDAWRERLAYARTMSLDADVAATLSNLGLAYGDIGQYKLATTTLQEALPLVAEHESELNLCNVFIMLSKQFMNQRMIDDAIDTGQRAVAIATAHDLKQFEGNARGVLGGVCLVADQLAAAAEQLTLALDIRQALLDVGKMAECHARLARVALARGEHKSALRYVDLVLEQEAYARSARPHGVLFDTFLVLNALADPRAASVLDEAHGILIERADKLTQIDQRHSFLHNVPEHAAILRAHTAHLP